MLYFTICMFILVLFLPLGVWGQYSCPAECQCSFTRPLTVFCNGTSLKSTTKKVPPQTVKYQYEAYEAEVNLGETDFSHLTALEVLHLSSPYDEMVLLRCIKALSQAQQRVFWPLKNLTELRININWELETPLPELFKEFKNLETLDLSDTRRLHYTGLRDTLVGLSNSTVFKSLTIHNSQTLEYLNNGLDLNLTDLLDPLKNCPLEEFDFSYNAIRTVVPGLISKAPKLKKLDASNNLINPLSLIDNAFFFEVTIHPSLVEADFSEQGRGVPQRKPSNDSRMFTNIPTVQSVRDLTTDRKNPRDFLNHPLYLRHEHCINRLFQDLCNIFQPECAHFLKNCIHNHTYFCKVFAVIFPLTSFIPCDSFPVVSTLLNPDCGGCFVFPVTGNIQKLHLQDIKNYDEVAAFPAFKYTTCFYPNNSLDVLDFSHNHEHGYADIDLSFSTPIKGFNSLTVFNLSHNQIQHPSHDLGSNLPQMEVFDISYNRLDLEGKYGDFLAGATSVRQLNLAGNIVNQIPYGRLTTLTRMQTLNMSDNILQNFFVDIRNLTELSTIDLSGNRISSLAPEMISQLSVQASNIKNKTGMSLMIDLSRNPLLCTCSVRPFTDWVLNRQDNHIVFLHYDEYTCLNDASRQVYFNRLDKPNILDCLSKNIYIGVGVCTGILSSAIIATVMARIYRKRWWIRYHYFIARRMLIHIQKQEEKFTDYRWDAFVSYNNHDRDWVEEVLQPTLEDENRIRLCIHERDFEYGGWVPDLIIESIKNSRKTILLLTPHFVKSNWCDFEMRMAHERLFTAGQDVLLLVILKPLVNVEISKTLKALLEQKNYVEWTEDEYGQKLFWAKLISALNVPERPAGAGGDEEDSEAGNIVENDDAPLINPSTSAQHA